MRSVLALLVVSSGCSLSLDPGDVAIVCDEDADCPIGRCELTLQRCFGSGNGVPLRFTSAVAVSSVRVDAVFNQAIAPASVVDVSQFIVEPALGLTGFALDASGQRLSITTDPQAFDVVYTLTVAGLVSNTGDALDESARRQAFTSFLGLADRSPPAIIRPADGSRVVGGEVDFAWQAISNAAAYTLEVRRRDDDGPAIVVEVPGNTTLATITLPLEGTYDWRVRADVTSAGAYSSASFDAVVDAIYVSCPDGDCHPRIGNGSRRAPVQSINEGLVIARQTGVGTVRIAARAAAAAYEETLVLGDTAVIVDGGFDSAFAAGAGRAEITAVGTCVLARPATGPLRIANVVFNALAAPSLEAISVAGGVDITLENVVIFAEAPVDTNVGFNSDGRPDIADVHLDAVTLVLAAPSSAAAADGALMTGIRARNTRLDITDSFVYVGLDGTSFGPQLARGIDLVDHAAIAATRLSVGVGYAFETSSALYDGRATRAATSLAYDLIDASRFWVTGGNLNIFAVYVDAVRDLVVRNSVIAAGAAQLANAVTLGGDLSGVGRGPWFLHDTLQVTSDLPSAAVASYSGGFIVANSMLTTNPCTNVGCYSSVNGCLVTYPTFGPATFSGNALACEVPYVGAGLGTPDFAQPSPSCVDGLGNVIRCNGTVVVPIPVNAYFADFYGADNSVVRAGDNDYHLVGAAPASLRSGALDLSGNVCGYASEALPCRAGDRDADEVLRTAPFAIGPYVY